MVSYSCRSGGARVDVGRRGSFPDRTLLPTKSIFRYKFCHWVSLLVLGPGMVANCIHSLFDLVYARLNYE